MKHLNATVGIIVVIFFAWAGAVIAVSKSPRPQPVTVRHFTQQSEFEAAANEAGATVQTVKYKGDCGPDEIGFSRNVSSMIFKKTPGTEVCCEASVRMDVPYYCASDQIGGLEGTDWGLGVDPYAKISECEIWGTVTQYSYYTVGQ